MRSLFRVVAMSVLVASCSDLPQEPVAVQPAAVGQPKLEDSDLSWQTSTTGYDVLVLGLFNNRDVIPLDINDAGQVIGILRANPTRDGVDRAFIWQNGTITDIGPTDAFATTARAINAGGQVVGVSSPHAVTWTSDGMSALPDFSGSASIGMGINDAGVMVGWAADNAVRWTSSGLDVLPKPENTNATAMDINNNGVVVGKITTFNPSALDHLTLWSSGGATEITLPSGAALSASHQFQGGRVINDAGDVVANLFVDNNVRGFVYRAGSIQQLPLLSDANQNWALGVAEDGNVVGASPFNQGPLHAVVWSTDMSIRDLGVVEGHLSSIANAMNRNGWVVGASIGAVNGRIRTNGVIWRTVQDRTPPVIAPTVTGTLGNNGWYVSDVTVQWTLTDLESQIPVTSGCITQTLSTDIAEQTYTCSATNSANLSAQQTATVKRDATPPVVAFSAHPSVVDIDAMISFTCSATDAMSGIAQQVCPNVNVNAYALGAGVQSWSASATDNAGNHASASTQVEVRATIMGLERLVSQFVSGPTAGALNSKLDAAQQAVARGKTATAENQLNAFINQVNAQTGKSITAEQAAILTSIARSLP